MSHETTEKTFEITGVPTVTIGNVRGLVTVQPGEDGLVSVVAVKHDGRGSKHTELKMEQDNDGVITIKTKHDGDSGIPFLFIGREPAKVDFTVTVPAEVNLTVKTVACDVDVHGLSGDVTLKSVSGPLEVRNLSGTLQFESVSGRITGDSIRGDLKLKTVSGKASLSNSDVPSLTATSVSGSLELATPLGAGPYHLKTVSGGAKIHLPEAAGGTVYFKSVSGSAKADGMKLKSNGHRPPGAPRKETYYLPGDGPEIFFNSVSGNLRLVTPDGALAVDEPESAKKAPAPANRMDVLEQLASGDLSVDEAVKLMQA